MRFSFIVEDEKTVTNDTVKVFVTVTGPASGKSRESLETRARQALDEFIPGASWAFAGFTVERDKGIPIFSVSGTTRIKAELNDDLARRAQEQEEDSVAIRVTQIDQRVPAHLLREGYAQVRMNALKLAKEEVERIREFFPAGPVRILDIDFTETCAPAASGKFSTANSYSPSGDAVGSAPIGYSEKISIKAKVTITDGVDEDRHQVLINY